MRRFAIWAVSATALAVVLWKMTRSRRGVSTVQRVAEGCERMMANMPASFPPNRMMTDLETIKETTARVLEVLEERATEPV